MKLSDIGISRETKQTVIFRLLALLAMLTALVELLRLTDGFGISMSYQFTAIILSVICFIPVLVLFQSRIFTVNRILLLFCVVSAVSLIFNHPLHNAMSALKFSLFAGMLCLLTPLVDNDTLRYFRRKLWNYAIELIRITVLLSFIGYFVTDIATDGDGSLYSIIPCPITLSTLSAIVSIALTSRLFSKEYGHRWVRVIDIISLPVTMLVIVWAGARSAMIGFAVAEVYMLYIYRKKIKTLGLIGAGVLIAVVLALLVGSNVPKKVIHKFEISSEHNSLFFSREQAWNARISEFAESPIIGIGFANVTHYATLYDEEVVEFTQYERGFEPGSSWLCVLSNTGIVGFLIMAAWNLKLIKTVRRRRLSGDAVAAGLGAMLLFFLVSGCFEGWVLFAGSIFFFLYWLLTSCILAPEEGNYSL